VPLVEHELPTLPEHPSAPLGFSGVRVTRSVVLYICFVGRCLSFCPFSFGHRGALGCSGRVGSSCSTSGTRRVYQHFLNRPPLGFPPPVSSVVLYELSIYHLHFQQYFI
jgi:hypothetical protein